MIGRCGERGSGISALAARHDDDDDDDLCIFLVTFLHFYERGNNRLKIRIKQSSSVYNKIGCLLIAGNLFMDVNIHHDNIHTHTYIYIYIYIYMWGG